MNNMKNNIKTKFNLSMLLVTAFLAVGVFILPANASRRGEMGFSMRSLMGSYASSGRAGGYLSRSVGVTWFDGAGRVRRVVTINTSDGAGGRKLLQVSSTGTYTVAPNGLGTVKLLNVFDTGARSEVNYDIVVSRSSPPVGGLSPLAEEITGIQREPGQTASLVEESWTIRPGQ